VPKSGCILGFDTEVCKWKWPVSIRQLPAVEVRAFD
jgi:hypothetical protein